MNKTSFNNRDIANSPEYKANGGQTAGKVIFSQMPSSNDEFVEDKAKDVQKNLLIRTWNFSTNFEANQKKDSDNGYLPPISYKKQTEEIERTHEETTEDDKEAKSSVFTWNPAPLSKNRTSTSIDNLNVVENKQTSDTEENQSKASNTSMTNSSPRIQSSKSKASLPKQP